MRLPDQVDTSLPWLKRLDGAVHISDQQLLASLGFLVLRNWPLFSRELTHYQGFLVTELLDERKDILVLHVEHPEVIMSEQIFVLLAKSQHLPPEYEDGVLVIELLRSIHFFGGGVYMHSWRDLFGSEAAIRQGIVPIHGVSGVVSRKVLCGSLGFGELCFTITV